MRNIADDFVPQIVYIIGCGDDFKFVYVNVELKNASINCLRGNSFFSSTSSTYGSMHNSQYFFLHVAHAFVVQPL